MGDVFAGIGVLFEIFDALDDTRGAKSLYYEPIQELPILQNALHGIEEGLPSS